MSSPTENKTLIRRFFAEIDAGNAAAMDELVAEDYVDHHPAPFPGLPPGRDGLKRTVEIFWRSTPGMHEILDQIAEGDLVFTRLRARSLFAKVNADVSATAVHRVVDGMLVERLGEADSASLIQQLGVQTAV